MEQIYAAFLIKKAQSNELTAPISRGQIKDLYLIKDYFPNNFLRASALSVFSQVNNPLDLS